MSLCVFANASFLKSTFSPSGQNIMLDCLFTDLRLFNLLEFMPVLPIVGEEGAMELSGFKLLLTIFNFGFPLATSVSPLGLTSEISTDNKSLFVAENSLFL